MQFRVTDHRDVGGNGSPRRDPCQVAMDTNTPSDCDLGLCLEEVNPDPDFFWAGNPDPDSRLIWSGIPDGKRTAIFEF